MIERKRSEGIGLTVLGFGQGNLKDATMEMLADKGNGNYAYIDRIEEAHRVLVSELGATLFTIAKDVKIQTEFNPALVRAYRLIGYENRMLAREDFHDDRKDAGELGAGHSVTALYEIVPVGAPEDDGSAPRLGSLGSGEGGIRPVSSFGDTLLFVKLRYKAPADSVSRLLIGPVLAGDVGREDGSDDLRHAAAVAELGMLLRDSKFRGSASYDDVIGLARGARGIDADGSRDAFIRLAERCRDLGRR
jgi:Ca-activated chloride channel family protein